MTALSDRAKWTFLVVFTLLLLAAVVLIAEVGFRIRQTAKYGTATTVDQQFVVDPRIGLRIPIANLNLGRVRTSALGFRSPDIEVPKPPGTVRIAFLGASTTWCAEVSSNEATWPHLVVEELRRRHPGARIDFVNGGVPGYTVRASINNLRHRVAPLDPDVIVIYHATNNLSGEVRDIAVAQRVIASAKFEGESWLAGHSVLWNLVEKNLRVMLAQNTAATNASQLRIDPSVLGEGFRRDLTELVTDAQRSARHVAVASFAIQMREGQSPAQLKKASESALYYMPFMTHAGLLASYARYNEVIGEVAKLTGAQLVEGHANIPGDPVHFVDSVHFTDEGSRKMAGRIVDALDNDRGFRAVLARSSSR